MEEKFRKSRILAGKIAEKKGLTAYEGQTIYIRYIEKGGKTLDDPLQMKVFNDMVDMYGCSGTRFLLHQPELFDIETDRG